MSNDNSKPETKKPLKDDNDDDNEENANENQQNLQNNNQQESNKENQIQNENEIENENGNGNGNEKRTIQNPTATNDENKKPIQSIQLADNNQPKSTEEEKLSRTSEIISKPTTSTQPSMRRHSEFYVLHKQKGKISINRRCHLPRSEGVNVKARQKLIIASILCLFFVACTIIGGIISNSLAVAADAAHTLTDFAGFMISLFAIWLAGREATDRLSFGWYRAEVIGALASVMTIWFVTAVLFWMAIERCVSREFDIGAIAMIITSIFGIVTNIILAIYLSSGTSTMEMKCKSQDDLQSSSNALHGHGHGHGHAHCFGCLEKIQEKFKIFKRKSKRDIDGENLPENCTKDFENINVKSAYLHVIGDALQSVSVLLAGVVIYFKPTWVIVDPICTFVFSALILYTTFNILKDIIVVLMEGTPTYMDYNAVQSTIEEIPGVKSIHHLRIWALSLDKVALAVHLVIEHGKSPHDILVLAEEAIHRHYNLFETTIQIEEDDESDVESARSLNYN